MIITSYHVWPLLFMDIFLSKKIVPIICIWSLTKCYWMVSWKYWMHECEKCFIAAYSLRQKQQPGQRPYDTLVTPAASFVKVDPGSKSCVTKCQFFFSNLGFISKWFDRTKPGRMSDCEANSGKIVELCHGMQWGPKTLTSSMLTLRKKQL